MIFTSHPHLPLSWWRDIHRRARLTGPRTRRIPSASEQEQAESVGFPPRLMFTRDNIPQNVFMLAPLVWPPLYRRWEIRTKSAHSGTVDRDFEKRMFHLKHVWLSFICFPWLVTISSGFKPFMPSPSHPLQTKDYFSSILQIRPIKVPDSFPPLWGGVTAECLCSSPHHCLVNLF